jgi:NTP pyrophosphatase (non-canonical NTP hydrolase)
MTFDEFQLAAAETAVYADADAITYPALGLASEVGEVTGHVKKMMRDDGGAITAERAAQLKEELGDVLWYVAMVAHDLCLSLDKIAEANLAKLASRQSRGGVQGSGDAR